MPARNVIRQYIEGGYYHIYNRGVEKRDIFIDEQDYSIFMYYLFIYLAPLETILVHYPRLPLRLQQRNLYGALECHAYSLMPNHFHLLLRQQDNQAITKLLRQITDAYTRYFNHKYNRVGSLFQGKFKAILVETDEYFVYLSKYIHRNPLALVENVEKLEKYKWSSYHLYTSSNQSNYIITNCISEYFSKQLETLSYKAFVEENDEIPVPTSYFIDNGQ